MYINDLDNPDRIYEADMIEGKTIAQMSGCYCPPHKGHFMRWYDVCKDLNLDILFIISTNHSRINKKGHRSFISRHGVPIEFTEWVVSKWASQLTNAQGKPVTVIFRKEGILYNITNNFKQLYFINIDEGNEMEKEKWIQKLFDNKKGDIDELVVGNWGRKNKITQGQNNESNQYPVYRISYKNYWRDTTNPGPDSPSATKFTKCLKNTKISLLAGEDKTSECFSYLPDFMSSEDKYEYIEKIMNEYYTDTAYAECKRLNPDEEELCSKYKFTSNGGKSKKSKKSRKSTKKTKKRKPSMKRKTSTKKFY
jgi:hypothetical protein